ncbi:MAG: hypothetical protein J7J36_02825 [Thermoplasmata archaeon]|nr:hypothetical protein [Thermoplasmata archaeon]
MKVDSIIDELFDTPEKKAKWLHRITLLYIIWIIFLITGISFLLIYWFFVV